MGGIPVRYVEVGASNMSALVSGLLRNESDVVPGLNALPRSLADRAQLVYPLASVPQGFLYVRRQQNIGLDSFFDMFSPGLNWTLVLLHLFIVASFALQTADFSRGLDGPRLVLSLADGWNLLLQGTGGASYGFFRSVSKRCSVLTSHRLLVACDGWLVLISLFQSSLLTRLFSRAEVLPVRRTSELAAKVASAELGVLLEDPGGAYLQQAGAPFDALREAFRQQPDALRAVDWQSGTSISDKVPNFLLQNPWYVMPLEEDDVGNYLADGCGRLAYARDPESAVVPKGSIVLSDSAWRAPLERLHREHFDALVLVQQRTLQALANYQAARTNCQHKDAEEGEDFTALGLGNLLILLVVVAAGSLVSLLALALERLSTRRRSSEKINR